MSQLQLVSKTMDRRLKSRIPAVPYDRMFPYFIYDSPDKANELKALFDKYKVCYLQAGFTIISFFLSSGLNIFKFVVQGFAILLTLLCHLF
jgi:hypothetical protein